ncbi:MAG TPA: hypothetical protein VMR37_02385 [Rhabdochlamydiaceae bacterium]|nr:hypothetical protein [Rhabdochlamydiaceae bacterium]
MSSIRNHLHDIGNKIEVLNLQSNEKQAAVSQLFKTLIFLDENILSCRLHSRRIGIEDIRDIEMYFYNIALLRNKIIKQLLDFPGQLGENLFLIQTFNNYLKNADSINRDGRCHTYLPIIRKNLSEKNSFCESSLVKGVHVFCTTSTEEIISEGELPTIVDYKVLHFISSSFLSHFPPLCEYDQTLKCIIPKKRSLLLFSKLWKLLKRAIALQIGRFENLPPVESKDQWRNSAINIADLMRDASKAASIFQNFTESVALQCSGVALFGPNKANITKTEKSLLERVARMQLAKRDNDITTLVPSIDDAVRGTIGVQTPDQLRVAVHRFRNAMAQNAQPMFLLIYGEMIMKKSKKY